MKAARLRGRAAASSQAETEPEQQEEALRG